MIGFCDFWERYATAAAAVAAILTDSAMIRMDHVYALSLAFMSGFMLGSLTIWRRQGPQQVTRRQSSRGSKRKSDVGKNVESSSASGAPVSPPGDAGGHQHDGGGHQQTMKGSRRSKRERKKRLCPKDLALDAFTKVARSHISCIGAGDYQSLLLLPRATFIQFGCFVPYASCRDSLVNLGQARTATASVDHLRILYVSCSWASTGDVQGSEDDFKTVRALLERSPDLAYVYVGRSCVASDKRQDVRAAQLRHVPLVLLRADTTLVLPRPTTSNDEEKRGISRPHSDINLHMRGAWSRMELAVGAVGQSKVLVVFRAPPFPETIWELKPGLTDVKEVAMKVVDAKETAAPGATNISSPPTTSRGSDENSEGKAVAAAAMKAACDAWLSSELNPLASLERARLAVAAAEDLAGAGLLHAIREMRPTPHSDVTEDLRKSLGEEHMAGETELAMSLLMFTVFCTQPKKRATYTDGFLEDTGKMEVVYRPIAVVRSPYKERFGTPRQPQVTAAVRHGGAQEGRIVFLKGHGYGEVTRAYPSKYCYSSVVVKAF